MTPKPITRAQYDALSPRDKGYAHYWQGAWNKQIPKACPYKPGTKEYEAWNEGQMQAAIHAQDSEE